MARDPARSRIEALLDGAEAAVLARDSDPVASRRQAIPVLDRQNGDAQRCLETAAGVWGPQEATTMNAAGATSSTAVSAGWSELSLESAGLAGGPERGDPTHSAAGLPRGVFVGRARELERLRAALDGALAGRGSVVLLAGDPGIGKTRLAQELEVDALASGAHVLWGRTFESGAPPLWPWVRIGQAFSDDHDIIELREKLGPECGHLVRLFPDLGELGCPPRPVALDTPESAEFYLFEAYTALLRAITSRCPAVLILEDLHWADTPTLKLLRYVAQGVSSLPLLLVGTHRDADPTPGDPLKETLAHLHREHTFEHISLRGLSEEDVASYLRSATGAGLAPGLAVQLHGRTDGNPFFLGEMVRLMASDGSLAGGGNLDARLPEGVREALGRRLARLGEPTHELLRVAAVAGRDFTYEVLAGISGHGDEELMAFLEDGLQARIIEEAGPPGRFRFVHALAHETLLTELSDMRRACLHGRIGEALERRLGDRVEEQAARLARHFVRSAAFDRKHAEKAVRYSRAAGEEALERLAWDEAAVHFEHALAQAKVAGGVMTQVEAALNEGIGRAYTAMGVREAEGFEALEHASRIYAATGDREGAFRVARVVGLSPALGDSRRDALLSRALGLQEDESAASGWLDTFLGYRRGIRGFVVEAQTRLARANSIATSLQDEDLALAVTVARANVETFNGRDGLSGHLRAAELAERIGDTYQLSISHFMAAADLIVRLELDRAAGHASRARTVAERTRQSYPIVCAAYGEAVVALLAGRLDDCEPLERSKSLDPWDHRIWSTLGWRALCSGDDDQVIAALDMLEERCSLGDDTLVGGMTRMSAGLLCAAWWWQTGDRGYLERARFWCDAESRTGEAVSAGRGLVALGTGDRARMAAWHDEPVPESGRQFGALLCVAHIRGLVDEELGRDEEALAHYEGAMTAVVRSPTLWALPAYERARLLARLGRGEALAAAGEVLAVTARIGMHRWAGKARALQRQLEKGPGPGVRESRAVAPPSGLTGREAEVLRLVATGMTNAQIAVKLMIAPTTVKRHISNILGKTGMTNRTEAAAYATKEGI